jgi:sRNA-binding protein
MARETQRYGLDGEPAGEIAPEHRQGALDELARRRERHAAQRAAEREAERATRQAQAEQARARRERAQLLRDFERTTLTAANFGVLKGLSAEALEQQLALARRERAERPPMPEARGPGGPRRDGPPHRGPRPERRAEAPRGPAEPGGDRPRGPRPPRPPR